MHTPNEWWQKSITPQRKPQAPRNFFRWGKEIKEHIRPWERFIIEEKMRLKRSFPFLTPSQALKKFLNYREDKARPYETSSDILRVIPFGWCEQVGLNSMAFEYKDELLIVDMGLQFPDQYQYGINASIPDLSYCRSKKVVGVCITHGHIDHIWWVYHALEQLGRNTPVYATPMAFELIKLKQGEMKATLPKLFEYKRNVPVQIGKYFQITPFTVDHSIPDSVGLCIETPVGRFIHTWDWKFDKKPLPNRASTDYSLLESFWNRGVRALFSDSTNAHLMGSSISESEVVHSIEEIFEKASGRVITATFSSIIDRVMLIISTAEKYDRKVVLLGRSMNNYIDIAVKLWYVRPKEGTLISMEQATKLPDNKVTICCTGAQWERYAALMRIVTGESRDTTLKVDDTIIFSSSVIPGNERAVQGLFDLISQQWPHVFHYKESEIHAGWHAREEDTKKMISLIRPELYIPIYGFPHMLYGNARNAYEMGYAHDKVIIMKNAQVLEFTKDSHRLTTTFIPHKLTTIDGHTVWYTTEHELHDRYQISTQWVVVIAISKKSGWYSIKYDTVWLPPMNIMTGLEKNLDMLLKSILHGDLSKFKDAHSFQIFVEKKATDLILHDIWKEPKVVVVVQ